MLAEQKNVLARHTAKDISYLCILVSLYHRQWCHSKGRVFVKAQWKPVMT